MKSEKTILLLMVIMAIIGYITCHLVETSYPNYSLSTDIISVNIDNEVCETWNNVNDLKVWLSSDNTSEKEYSTDYDCDDFAVDLCLNGLKHGKLFGLYMTKNDTLHLEAFTFIKNEIWKVETQTDNIMHIANVDN
jgi:hypothetical protein